MKTFDFNSVEEFDRHINMSIPNYAGLTEITERLILSFQQSGTSYIDLGCSTGRMCHKIYNSIPDERDLRIFGVDMSDLLNPVTLESDKKSLVLDHGDICSSYVFGSPRQASVITSIFTLQFIDPVHRDDIIRRCYDKLVDGGVFLLAEKTNFANADMQRVTHGLHYEKKLENFTADEILNKQVELINSMRPDSMQQLISRIEKAGFNPMEPYWSSYGFQAFICTK